ncbi:SLC13 family permease [Thalassospira marina]|uniref:Potassium transporter TrkA n=1 Tax=Thalassospira marina TaxID=2048283 RepID=A0ABM6QGY7_9PROT|nr:SLC13 family permease [Thalassospira marina]AUG55879.1 potassium transporter TrkA [Thalassospira marina]
MNFEQLALVAIIVIAIAAMASDRFRYDLVAVLALLAAIVLGVVPQDNAFAGFSNGAVVTVAGVLIITRTIIATGAMEPVSQLLSKRFESRWSLVAIFCATGAVLSAFMNNIGALALLMPVALAATARRGEHPGYLLMPLSFATLLGGMTTLIGTPANLIISQIRDKAVSQPFDMFDFWPVGSVIAVSGVSFLVAAGWRMIPGRDLNDGETREAVRFLTELRVGANGISEYGSVLELEGAFCIRIHGIVRDNRRVFAPKNRQTFEIDDLVIIEADLDVLEVLCDRYGFRLPGQIGVLSDDDEMVEAVVPADSIVQGSNLHTLEPKDRWQVDIVALARQSKRFDGRLADATLMPGDILIFRGNSSRVDTAISDLGLLPLAARTIRLRPRAALWAVGIFAFAIILAASGITTPAISFVAAVTLMLLTRVTSARDLYRRVEGPVLVLLAALIPIGEALRTTGTAELVAGYLLQIAGSAGPMWLLAFSLVLAMAITPILNNVTAVIVLAPIVMALAYRAGLAPDAFLMAVAIGASTDFLTPIGHHNNTIIMGPGGYRFRDYWRCGLPVSIVVFIVSMILLPVIFPI